MFHIGQLIVCVDDAPTGLWVNNQIIEKTKPLEKGRIYTIRNIDKFRSVNIYSKRIEPDALSIWLEEIIRNHSKEKDLPFGAWRFQPVAKTDISIFTAMLAPTPAKEDA